MDFVSIFNDVIGPVMYGPSSSHTAGSFRIGKMARSLLGQEAASAEFVFDPEGSYIKTYKKQSADLGFASGLMGWEITDNRFHRALSIGKEKNIKIDFLSSELKNADHPNAVEIRLISRSGKKLNLTAKSTGGGGIEITKVNNWPVSITGKSYDILIEVQSRAKDEVINLISDHMEKKPECIEKKETSFCHCQLTSPLPEKIIQKVKNIPDVVDIKKTNPVFFVKKGESLFSSGKEILDFTASHKCSLGEAALFYESKILGLSEKDILEEMESRYRIMNDSVHKGLDKKNIKMQLLKPFARNIYDSESRGNVAIGGIHTRAAARAMAALHISNSKGLVCAAPTGGSSGVIPGVLVSLAEDKKIEKDKLIRGLFAAAAVGLILKNRATFAAETAGCQVEIGAAGAMASAAVSEIYGANPKQAMDAAAISLQNTMGSVCDLVQGICEIPCHTRNAAAASSAFVCADLILGGYTNPIPLDETIDASFSVGKMLPSELRCTAKGGLAATPSALSLSLDK
ncbi:MAG: L-serine ammonia-lyase, iron-sulfur-dependent, subunit alpha [Candidatus Aminicenantaceae bacterium]